MDGKYITAPDEKSKLHLFLSGKTTGRSYYVWDFKEVKEDESTFYNRLLTYKMFLVCICTRGEMELDINLSTYRILKEDIIFYAPSSVCELKRYSTDCDAVCIGIVPEFFHSIGLQLTGKTMMDLFPLMSNHVIPASHGQTAILFFLLQKLKRLNETIFLHHHKEITHHYLMALLYELIDFRAKHMNTSNSIKFSRKTELRTQFLDWILKYFREERSVQFYADKLCVTPKYLSEVIKELTGKTAGEMIDELVILEAKLLLSDNERTMKDIAEKLNFSDPSFFGKFFKRYTGFAPSRYRDKLLQQ